MDEQIKHLLNEEISADIEELSNLISGSSEKSKAIDELVKLCNLKIESAKCELEYAEKLNTRESEEHFKQIQLHEQARDRYFKLGVETAGIILPLIFYAVWMKRGFKFEEKGTYTSTTFRGLFSRFKPTVK